MAKDLDLDAIYNQIREAGKHTVDGIVSWLQDSQVIDKAQHTEEKVRSYFDNAVDKGNITAEKFKEAVKQIAQDQKKTVEDLSTTLSEYGNRFLHALEAGSTAFLQAMNEKK